MVALTCGSPKYPDWKTVANGSVSDTLAGLPHGSAGFNGVGKIIMSNTAIGSPALDVGIVTTPGYDARSDANMVKCTTGATF